MDVKPLTHSQAMAFIAEGSLILLEAILGSVIIYIFYVITVRSKNAKDKALYRKPATIFYFLIFAALATGVLVSAHVLAHKQSILASFLLLTIGWIIIACLYSWLLSPGVDDERIRYTLIILAAFAQLICVFLFLIWWAGDRFSYEAPFKIEGQSLAQLINNAMQIIGVVIAAAMIVVTNLYNARQVRQTSQQQIYQTLELQSIELFRFETNHPKIVEQFWYPEDAEARRETENIGGVGKRTIDYLVRQYVCQILNLFEMAFRFRKEGIVPVDVFGSWIIWMWETCREPKFQQMWEGAAGLGLNYVGDFRGMMDKGVQLAAEIGPEAPAPVEMQARIKFAEFAAEQLGGCEVLPSWFGGDDKALIKSG